MALLKLSCVRAIGRKILKVKKRKPWLFWLFLSLSFMVSSVQIRLYISKAALGQQIIAAAITAIYWLIFLFIPKIYIAICEIKRVIKTLENDSF